MTYFILFILWIYLVLLTPIRFIPKSEVRRTIQSYATHYLCKILLRCFGVRVKMEGSFPKGNYLIVSNHVSYLDMILIAAQKPCIFVTSWEQRDKPILGLWIKASGCLTVDRVKFTSLLFDIKELGMVLGEGSTCCLFPEATTTNGELLPFRPALIQGAVHGGTPVLPLALKYQDPCAHFYGTMEIVPHIKDLLGRGKVEATLKVGDLFNPQFTRKENAKKLKEIIASMLVN